MTLYNTQTEQPEQTELSVTACNTQIEQPKKNEQQPRTYTTREVTREATGEAIAKYTYMESCTHGLIIEVPIGYVVNKPKWKHYDPAWRNE